MLNPPPSARRWQEFALPVAVAALLLWLMSARFEIPAPAMDEGTLLVYPEQILKGKLPYRDFETAYGPANPFVLAGAYAVFGPGIFVERAVGLCYRLAILAAIFAITRRWGTTVAAGSMMLAGVFLVPTNVVAYAWMGGMACALWAVWAAADGTALRKFSAGVLAGAALLFRPDLGPAVLLSAAVAVWGMKSPQRRLFAVGATCGLAPLALLALVMGPLPIYENLFHFPVILNERALPIRAGWMVWVLALHGAACLLAIVSGWLGVRADRQDIRARLLLAAGLCALGCTHQAVQRLDAAHLFFACFTSIGLFPVALLATAERMHGASASRSRPLLAVATAMLTVAIVSPRMITSLHQSIGLSTGAVQADTQYLRRSERVYPLASALEVQRTAACIDAVLRHAQPGDRLFVGPHDLRHTDYNDTFLYHLLPQLTPATYFLEMNPGSANRPHSRLADDVASADWVVLNKFWDLPDAGASDVPGREAPGEVVRTQFTRVHEFAGFEVYRKTRRIARQ